MVCFEGHCEWLQVQRGFHLFDALWSDVVYTSDFHTSVIVVVCTWLPLSNIGVMRLQPSVVAIWLRASVHVVRVSVVLGTTEARPIAIMKVCTAE